MKRTRTQYAKVYGMEGSGPTASAARKDAIARIERATKGSRTPEILAYDGNAMLLYRDLDVWRYAPIYDQGEFRTSPIGGSFYDTREECYDRAACHLAQNAQQLYEWWTVEDVPEFVTSEEDRRFLVGYARWQRAARHAQKMGLDSQAVHAWACEHERDEQFTRRPTAAA
jgi:hypothetical protein